MDREQHLVVYTDGSSNAQTGFGGFGWHYRWAGDFVEHYEGHKETTNNRMELTAVSSAITALLVKYPDGMPGPVVIHSDSQYVVKGCNEWLPSWIARKWKTSTGKAVKNQDLWEAMRDLLIDSQNQMSIVWVKGHAGVEGNEYADELAGKGYREAQAKG